MARGMGMKPKNLKEAYRQIKKLINNLDYSHNENVIGDINNDTYVQFVPQLHCYFNDKDGEAVEEVLSDSIDLRKLSKSPSGIDWRKQLLGNKK